MKTRWYIFPTLMLLLVGCTVVKIDSDEYIETINSVIEEGTEKSNTFALGFKYYLPMGTTIKNVTNFNQTIYTKDSNYYLYVDVSGYYHKIGNTYKRNKEAYFSEFIDINNLSGYLEINQYNEKYFIEMVIENSKVEAFVEEENLIKSIIDITYILNSITFNDSIIETIIGDNQFMKELEVFNIFEQKATDSKFMLFIEEYDRYDAEEGEFPDYDGTIDVENNDEFEINE